MLPISLLGVCAFVLRRRFPAYLYAACNFVLVVLTATLAATCISSGKIQVPLTSTLSYYDDCAMAASNATVASCLRELEVQQFASTHLLLLGGLASLTCVSVGLTWAGSMHLAYLLHVEHRQETGKKTDTVRETDIEFEAFLKK
jgi:hypothetical protein